MAKIISGERGGLILVVDGYRYQRHRYNQGMINWRCWRRGTCQARLRTNNFNLEVPGDVEPQYLFQEQHDHGPDDVMVARAEARDGMKQQVLQNPTVPVYNAAVAEVQRQPVQGGGDRPPRIEPYQTFRTILNRTRVSQLPEIPADVADVVIEGDWAESWLHERFLMHQDNDWGIAAFAPDANLRILQQCREVYMDGTFRCCPRPYNQFFTVLGRYRGWVVSLVTVLMTNRDIGSYRQVLQAIKRHVRNITHHQLRPQTVVCDFELALINAVETELPNGTISGCYFHFTQNLWRRVQELGLSGHYRQNHHLRRCIRKVMSLGYLPIPILRMNFDLLRTARRTGNLINRYPALMDFFAYVSNTYVNGTFALNLWNVYERDMDMRTNNNVESKYINCKTYCYIVNTQLALCLKLVTEIDNE